MGIIFSILGFGKSIGAFLGKIPWQGYASAAGILALLFAWHIHSGWEKRAYNDAFNAGWTKQKVYTDINLRSIGTLQQALADKSRESDKRASDLAASKAQDAADVKAADVAQKADASRRGLLAGIRDGAALKPSCRVPDALSKALDGL